MSVSDCTVIIPYFNGEQTIERALASVMNQSKKPKRLVVVDDGSHVDSVANLKTLQNKYDFELLTKSNGGQGSARNAGVAIAQTEFIAFLDQDDFFLPEHLETLSADPSTSSPRFGFVYGDLFEANFLGEVMDETVVRFPVLGIGPTRLTNLLAKDLFVLPSAALISRAAFVAVGGFDEQFRGYEDDDLFLRIFLAGFTHTFIPKPVAVWCMHTGSTSYSIQMSRSRWAYFSKLALRFPDEPLKNRFYFRDCLVPRFQNMFIADVIQSHSNSGGRFTEVFEILKSFRSAVARQKSIKLTHKFSITLIVWLLSLESRKLVTLARFMWRHLNQLRPSGFRGF